MVVRRWLTISATLCEPECVVPSATARRLSGNPGRRPAPGWAPPPRRSKCPSSDSPQPPRSRHLDSAWRAWRAWHHGIPQHAASYTAPHRATGGDVGVGSRTGPVMSPMTGGDFCLSETIPRQLSSPCLNLVDVELTSLATSALPRRVQTLAWCASGRSGVARVIVRPREEGGESEWSRRVLGIPACGERSATADLLGRLPIGLGRCQTWCGMAFRRCITVS